MEEEITNLLKREQVVQSGGMSMLEIQAELSYPEVQVSDTVHALYDKGVLVGVPDKKAGTWYRKYYFPPHSEQTVLERLEQVFTEIGIPSFIDVRVSRAGRTFLIGVHGRTPFTIVDYSSDPPLVLHDRRAGGKHTEIVYSKKRYRYVCKRGSINRVYDHHGNPA
ncbi:MAG: hypothetical protein WCC94_03705 [Candidatus Bathyarchaeia archaeon]